MRRYRSLAGPRSSGKVRPFAAMRTVEQAATGRPFHILCRACGSDRTSLVSASNAVQLQTSPAPSRKPGVGKVAAEIRERQRERVCGRRFRGDCLSTAIGNRIGR
jgi:hypothetical protein